MMSFTIVGTPTAATIATFGFFEVKLTFSGVCGQIIITKMKQNEN